MLSLLSGVLAGTAQFGSEDPLAPVERAQWHHRGLTCTAAVAEGWSEASATELSWITLGVDLYAYHPIWTAYGGPRRWRGAGLARPALEALHFDDLGSFGEIEEIWHRLLGGTLAGLTWALTQNNVPVARHVVGVGLHAVQDFYSHSNWLDDPKRREVTWLESWHRTRSCSDLGSAPDGPTMGEEMGLYTGRFTLPVDDGAPLHGETRLTSGAVRRLPAMLVSPLIDAARAALRLPQPRQRPRCSPSPPPGVRYGPIRGMNLDSHWQAAAGSRPRLAELDGEAAFELALRLATRESQLWLRLLGRWFDTDPEGQAFWAKVRSSPAADWRAAYNDPAARAYEFLAAGRYPPGEGKDSRAWFLRVSAFAPRGRAGPYRIRPGGADSTLGIHSDKATRGDATQGKARLGQVSVLGPVDPQEAVVFEGLPPATRLYVCAFRRAPTLAYQVLFDGVVAGAGPFRLELAGMQNT